MKRQVGAFLVSIGAGLLSIAAVVSGELLWAAAWATLAIGAGKAARVWSRRHPVPMPHFMRWVLLLPRGPHSSRGLKRILEPRSGERVLEIGPGVGVHALPVAASLLPGGALDALDVQQEMLCDLNQRAARAGIGNIVVTQGDAQALPYPDRTFDAAYLIGVLGEIPDEAAALLELRRVLKPSGRLVIGEVVVDPDYVSFAALKGKAKDAGFVLERTTGPRFSYFARFRPAARLDCARPGSCGGIE